MDNPDAANTVDRLVLVARAIEGPHTPPPVGCLWTLDQLREIRWHGLSHGERRERLSQARSVLTLLA